MKKARRPKDYNLRREYDFASMRGGVRGKYAERLRRAGLESLAEGRGSRNEGLARFSPSLVLLGGFQECGDSLPGNAEELRDALHR